MRAHLARSFVFAIVVASWTSFGHAADDTTEARSLYSRGAASYDAGDYQNAAVDLARADALVPHETTLRLALTAATRADDVTLALTLAERAKARGEHVRLAETTIAKLAPRAARLRVVCPANAKCTASLDQAPHPVGVLVWTRPGAHRLNVRVDDIESTRALELLPESIQDVVLEVPRTAAAPVTPIAPVPPAPRATTPATAAPLVVDRADAAPARRGAHPAWFWTGVAVTGVLGASTALSGADAVSIHDDFARDPSTDLADRGQAAQARTNVLLVSTIVVAAATTFVGAFVVDWGGRRAPANARR